MAIPGTTPVTARIAPTSEQDEFATHEARWGKGGYRTVATDEERDAIKAERREEGMIVLVAETGSKWRMAEDLETWIAEGEVTGVVDPNGVIYGDNSRYVNVLDLDAITYWYHPPARPPTNTGWKQV